MLKEKLYDVIVVGAGFAGPIAAAKIAAEGVNPSTGEPLKVALIEGGPYYKGKPKWGYGHPLRRRMFTHIPQDMKQGGRTERLLGGWTFHGIGGGSLKWGAKGFPPGDVDYQVWARETGVDWTQEDTQEAVDELQRLWHSHTVPDDMLTEYHFEFKEAAESMGYQTEKMLVHKKNCIMCGTHYEDQPQCRYDAKMSTLLSHIPAAEEHGVDILPDRKVERLILEKKGTRWTATGVWYMSEGTAARKIEGKKIILAGGQKNPLLLYNSGYGPRDLLGDKLVVENPNVGSHIDGHLRSVMEPVTARFKNMIVHEPGDGNFGFWFVDDKDNMGSERLFILSGAETHGSNYGGAHSYALSPWAPEFGRRHKDWMRKNWKEWRHIAGTPFNFGPLVTYSHWSGTKARVFPDGHVEYKHNEEPSIKKRIKECRDLIWSLLEKMGAAEIKDMPKGHWPEPEGFMHTVGSCRAGADRKNSVINSDFECHDIDNLFVVDSTAHPRVTSLWSGGAAVSAMGTYAAQRIIKNHFTRSSV